MKSGRTWGQQSLNIDIIQALLIIFILVTTSFLVRCSQEEDTLKPDEGKEPPTTVTNTTVSSSDNISISNISVFDITASSITATWTTNVPTTSELRATMLSNNTTVSGWPEKTPALEHRATLSELLPSTAYKLTVVSVDAAGNQVEFEIKEPYVTLATPASITISVGDRSPEFSLTSIGGTTVYSSEYAGKRAMIVFWKLSCNDCRGELPYINTFFNNSARSDIVLITISVREKPELVRSYIEGRGYAFTVLLDSDEEVAKKFSVVKYPIAFLIDPSGNVVKIKEGPFKDTTEINEFVD